MELTAAGARTGCRAIFLIGILSVARFIRGKGPAVVPCVLVLHTGLIGYNRIARRIKRHTIQEGIEGRGSCPT